MKWLKITILVILGISAFNGAYAQSADDYFHQGAQTYVHGQLERAIAILTDGLKRYPYDARIKALLEKIKKQQKNQQQNKQNQQNQQQQNQKQNQQNKEDKQKQQQNKQNQQNNPQNQQQPRDQQKPQTAQGKKEREKPLSREEAERILKALQGKIEQGKKPPIRIVGKKKKVEKDW